MMTGEFMLNMLITVRKDILNMCDIKYTQGQ